MPSIADSVNKGCLLVNCIALGAMGVELIYPLQVGFSAEKLK